MNTESELQHYAIRHPKKAAFLHAFAATGMVSKAAEEAEVHRTTHYVWMKQEGEEADAYRAAFHALGELVDEAIEDEIFRRAVKGTQKPVFYKGDICGHIQEYSDTLLIFLAKARMPRRYRDNTIDVPSTPIPESRSAYEQLLSAPDYLEYLRSRALSEDSDPSDVRPVGEQGQVAPRPASGNGRPRPGPDGKGRAK